MEPIKTFDRLIFNLNMGPGYEGYVELVKAIDLKLEELEAISLWDDAQYQRIQFYDTPELEGIMTCWRVNQYGPIHNNKSNVSWVKVAKGELTIRYFREGENGYEPFTTMTLKAGELAMLSDGIGFHQFMNNGSEDAIAIHLNADRINNWDVYNEETGLIDEVAVKWDRKLKNA